MPSQGLRLHLFLRSACSSLCADVGAWEKAAGLIREEDDVVAVNGVLSASARFARGELGDVLGSVHTWSSETIIVSGCEWKWGHF